MRESTSPTDRIERKPAKQKRLRKSSLSLFLDYQRPHRHFQQKARVREDIHASLRVVAQRYRDAGVVLRNRGNY
jgi:hypothetical protein